MWNHPGISSHSHNLRRIRQWFWCINAMMLGSTVTDPSRSRPHVLGAHSGQRVGRWRQFWGSCIPPFCTQPISTLKPSTWLNSCFPLLPVYFQICSEFILLLITSAPVSDVSFLKTETPGPCLPAGISGTRYMQFSSWLFLLSQHTLSPDTWSFRREAQG